MCLKRKEPHTENKKIKNKKNKTNINKKVDYLTEDPSIKHEAHSEWEADDIYDEDDFKD